jgi:protein-disulfide isomerase/uncharacterized membrane protein
MVVMMTESSPKIQTARFATILFSLIGIGLSYVALQQHVVYVNGFETGPSFCHLNAHFNCEAVNASEWSSVFGIPVASYGLFFYALLLLGSVCATSRGRILSLRTWSAIVVVLSTLASFLSIALFAISEIFIGSLCLMCIGLYIVNFSILGTVWLCAWKGRFGEGLRHGVAEGLRLVGVVFGLSNVQAPASPWRIRVLSLLAVVAALVSVILPEVLYQSYAAQEMVEPDPISQWKSAPVQQFSLQLEGGAFGDYSLGDKNSPIQIVEFADYECPACKMMHGLMKNLLEKYQGKYLFVFKNYPLDKSCNPEMERDLHQYACTAAYFSRCAGEQGKFWEAATLLFLRDAEKGELSQESLVTEGTKEIGIDDAAMRECITSGRYHERILTDIKAGSAAGLQGTPSVWVNGKLVSQPSPEVFEAIFNSILIQSGGATP